MCSFLALECLMMYSCFSRCTCDVYQIQPTPRVLENRSYHSNASETASPTPQGALSETSTCCNNSVYLGVVSILSVNGHYSTGLIPLPDPAAPPKKPPRPGAPGHLGSLASLGNPGDSYNEGVKVSAFHPR